MELEIKGCVADKVGGAAVSSLCFGTTTQYSGCYSDSVASTSFSSGDDSETSEGLYFDPAIFDEPSTSTAPGSSVFGINCPTSVKGDLKEVPLLQDLKLTQHLKKIRAIDYSMQFCCVLIKAEDSSYYDTELSQMLEKFLNDLKETMHGHIDVVETLLEVMKANKTELVDFPGSESLISFFDLKKNPHLDPKISLQELKELSNFVKKLVEQFCDPEIYYYSSELIELRKKSLHWLKNLLDKLGLFEAYCVLISMYAIGRDNLLILDEERKEIERLLIRATKYIEKYIRNISSPFKLRLNILDLQLRSSLQFIVDYFPNLTDKYMDELKNCITILDELYAEEKAYQQLALSSHNVDYTDDLGEYVHDNRYSNEKEEVIKRELDKMPEKHTWWKGYIEIYFKK